MIPILLVLLGATPEYPDPVCSKCSIILREDASAPPEEPGAILEIEYPEDEPAFAGTIELTVWLKNDQTPDLSLTDVTLAPGAEAKLAIDASLDWDEARFAWLRFVPE